MLSDEGYRDLIRRLKEVAADERDPKVAASFRERAAELERERRQRQRQE